MRLTKFETVQLISICQILLILIVRISDYFIEYFVQCNICKILSDNICHSTIAGTIYLITNALEKIFLSQGESLFSRNRIIVFNPNDLVQILSSMTIGSLLDLDHIIYAQSFSYYSITHLSTRPFGHSITFCIIASIISLIVSWKYPIRAGVLTFSAIFSHQLRDSGAQK